MEISNEQRDQAYEKASEQQQYLYASPASGSRMRNIANKNGIVSAEQYKNYALVVGDVILNLRNRSELPTALSQTLGISTEQSIKITGDLIDFFDQSDKTDTNEELASDIAETEATLRAIPHVRTMAEDMKQTQASKETTYTSTQETILREGRSTGDKSSTQ